jgi:hypothetical protein
MPVETLTELVQYRELILGVARAQFLSTHPKRERMPRGFFDRLQLRLKVVEDGSATPVLERVAPPGSLLVDAADEFTHARDSIESAVAAVESGDDIPEDFPLDALVLFNRFGQTLRPDEAIELRGGGAQTGPCYTAETRRNLVLRVSKTYQEELRDIGWVSEVDANGMRSRIRLRTRAPSPVLAPLDEISFGPVKEVLEPNGEGPPVWISGMGVFDASRRLLRLDAIHDVRVLDDPDDLALLDSRLDELASMESGWLDGDGVRPDVVALELARRVLAELLAFEVPRPRVFATPEGGVQAEWSLNNHEVSVAFEPNGDLYAVSVDLASGESDEPEISAAAPEQIAELLRGGAS